MNIAELTALQAAAQKKYKAQARLARARAAEELVRIRLMQAGCTCVEKIATPATMRAGRFVRTAKVMGDWRAVYRGRAVLVEVKHRENTLGFTDLEPHQRAALHAYEQAGAIAILAWVSWPDCWLLRWPCPRLQPGAPLHAADAAGLAMSIPWPCA